MDEDENVVGGRWGMWRTFGSAKSSHGKRSGEIWWDPIEAVAWEIYGFEFTGRGSGPSSRFERLIV